MNSRGTQDRLLRRRARRAAREHRGQIGGRAANHIGARELVARAVAPERADRDDTAGAAARYIVEPISDIALTSESRRAASST